MSYPIAIVTERAPGVPGGVSVASERIARQAAQRGHEVHVVAWSKQAAPGARVAVTTDAFTLHRIGPLPQQADSLMALTGHLRDVISAHGVRLVHGIYAVHAGYATTVAANCQGVPSIVSVRGNDIDRAIYRVEQLPFVSHALQHATAVTGVSRALCELAGRTFDRQVRYVPNSVDAHAFRPETPDNSLRSALNLGDARVLGFMGELREKKGMRYLLPAFAELARIRPVKLLLIGGVRADCRDAYSEFERSAPDAASDVIQVNYERDPTRLSRLLALCDALVFPSLSEGMPNAVLETMAAARPVLATDVGGHRDLIEHGQTGALLSTHELDRLPWAIEELLDLPAERRSSLGGAARAYVLRAHLPEQESAHYAELYTEVCDSYPRRI